MKSLHQIWQRLFSGSRRTVLAKKNIVGSLLIKGWSAIIQFLIVPLSLVCLTKYEYGIWLIINSVLIGIDSIDVGFGNGLRNRLAEAMAMDNKELARRQVSTTFAMLAVILIPVILIAILAVLRGNPYSWLNIDPAQVQNLPEILVASIAIMGSTFIFKFIGNMYLGLQLPAVNNLLVVLGQTLALLLLYVVSLNGKCQLMTVAVIFTASPLVVYLIAYPVSFMGKYKFLSPSWRYVDTRTMRDLFKLGCSFFIIQITGLALFMCSNFIISSVLSPADVTPYQISYRYFSLVYVLFAIVAAPLWAATTDAYSQGDWGWINGVMRRMRQLLLLSVGVLCVMVLVSKVFYGIWTQHKVDVEYLTSCLMAGYVFLLVVSNCYSYILFGIGKIRLIMVYTILQVLVFVPLEYFACKHFGLDGLIVSLILATAFSSIINIIQFHKLSHGTATGIWNQ